MTAHDFEPNTPPAPDPDRLRALEAALEPETGRGP
jgi:hypothetical protein